MLGKADIAQQVAERGKMPRTQAVRAIDALMATVEAALGRGEQVRLTGFGSWRVTDTKARKGRNPRTGAPIDIKAGRRVSFSAGSKLVESVRPAAPKAKAKAAAPAAKGRAKR